MKLFNDFFTGREIDKTMLLLLWNIHVKTNRPVMLSTLNQTWYKQTRVIAKETAKEAG